MNVVGYDGGVLGVARIRVMFHALLGQNEGTTLSRKVGSIVGDFQTYWA